MLDISRFCELRDIVLIPAYSHNKLVTFDNAISEALIRKGGVFMKKRSNKSFLASPAYLVVALVLCAGVIFYTGNGGTGLTVADITDTMPETGTDEIVAGEEEVQISQRTKGFC